MDIEMLKMSWNKVKVERHHQEAFKAYQVVGVLQTNAPLLCETIDISYIRKRPLDLLEEFVARAVAEVGGFQTDDEIAEFLGLQEGRFVAPVLSDLKARQLVKVEEDGMLQAEETLKIALSEKAFPEAETKTVEAYFDPLRRTFYPGHSRDVLLERWESDGFEPSSPTESQILEMLRTDYPTLRSQNSLKIDNVEQNALGLYPVQAVIIIDEIDDCWDWQSYDPKRKKIAPEFAEVCEALRVREASLVFREEAEEVKPDIDEQNLSDSKEELLLRIMELEDELKKEKSREKGILQRLKTGPAKKEMHRQIKKACNEVILRFPWIRKGAISNELIANLRQAIRNGASVYICYGIGDKESKEESHDSAIKALKELKPDIKTGSQVHVFWTGMSHSKEAIIDRKHYFTGSFNLLSFRGDPDWDTGKLRIEVMIHTDDQEAVKAALLDIVPSIQTELRKRLGLLEETGDFYGWCDKWKGIVDLTADPKLFREALDAFSSRETISRDKKIVIMNTAMEGIGKGLDSEVNNICLEHFIDWMSARVVDKDLTNSDKKALAPVVGKLERIVENTGIRKKEIASLSKALE